MPDTNQVISFVKLAQVRIETQKSASAIHRDVRSGTFPAPVKTGPRSVAWTRDSLETWKRGCIEASQKS